MLALRAYQVADARGLIKLDAMENPYPLPEVVRKAWAQRLAAVAVNRYPDPEAAALKAALRSAMDLPLGASLMLGNGSDELLQILISAVARPGATLVTPAPGFAMFGLIARAAGLRHETVDLTPEFALDADAMRAAIDAHRPALVIVAQPNNPTGNAFDAAALRAVVEAAPGLVVIDEAYYPFADADCRAWLDDYPHLLLLRTVSKLGLAGLRLGLLAGAPRWIEALEPLRLPYNINALTQAGAEVALSHYDAFAAQAAAIVAERRRLHEALAALPGLTVHPSQANFLLVRVPAGRAPALHAGLRDAGILVKLVDGSHPLVADCLRITVGSPEGNTAVITALGDLLGA
ncbi:histidinol-phosphate aminotransferase [Salinisphaera sp. PC39]|uniref:histidinol-phosphate transaminase n=1 Tax=Salinisphaera sp. PC39 TaxID=1304156 RepID=UPI00333FF41E